MPMAYEPVGQGKHDWMPAIGAYVPGAQKLHDWDDADAANLPGVHAVKLLEPTLSEMTPTGVGKQAAWPDDGM